MLGGDGGGCGGAWVDDGEGGGAGMCLVSKAVMRQFVLRCGGGEARGCALLVDGFPVSG